MGAAPSQVAVIGGNIWTGAQTPDGKPQYTGNDPILDARVMVQEMDSGDFVTYARVSGNSWQTVVVPGEYVVMFSAPGHDCTSRQFLVRPDEVQFQDAYLPPMPLPKAGLLVYAFLDNAVNGEDDFPDDWGLSGVTFRAWNERGEMVAEGVSGDIAPGQAPSEGDPAGLYYFEGLEPGEYLITADPSTIRPRPGVPGYEEWYLTTSEEGGPAWEVRLFPGDSGKEEGSYLIWFGFVPKLGQFPDGTGTGSISGTLLDADGNDVEEPFPYAEVPLVTPNLVVPDGLVILYTFGDQEHPRPFATVEADPVTGEFSFQNVPPGNYKIVNMDLDQDYVWTASEASVSPGEHVRIDPLVPRFGARVQGYVTDVDSNRPITGANMRIRLKDGSVFLRATTDANGWYNFDFLPEVETIALVDVELPAGYRGARRSDSDYPLNTRYVQWWTYNYRADLQLSGIPGSEGDLGGVVFNDQLERGTWLADGLYDEDEERLFGGIQVNLYDESDSLVSTTTTAALDKAALMVQGWHKPYVYPPDEIGNVYEGELIGHYSFEGLAPGNYRVEVIPPAGFQSSPEGSNEVTVTIQGGQRTVAHFGINTLVPLAGEIEGGVWDDINIDSNRRSLMFEEKAAVTGVGIGFYDHLGYRIGSGVMGNPLCYEGSTACPPGEDPIQEFEMERRLAPSPHIFIGNDPALPGYNVHYAPLVEVYTFGQGKFKTEADWSLMSVSFGGLSNAHVAATNVLPKNRPGITSANRSSAARGERVRIEGSNFGDAQGYSTVTLAGERLPVTEWAEGHIEFEIPADAVSGVVLVATSTGISNGRFLEVTDAPGGVDAVGGSFVYVDARHTGTQDGTAERPYRTITQALANLPAEKPRRVYVAPGDYRERIQIRESDVQLLGSGPQETVLNGIPEAIPMPVDQGVCGAGPVVFIGAGGQDGGVRDIRISGLSITGGTVRNQIGAGIFADYGNRNIDINTCIIHNNGGYYGGGIWMHLSNHDVLLHSNTIAENGNYGGYGGGISINDEPEYGEEHGEPEHVVDDRLVAEPPGRIEITNNVIFHNYSPDYGSAACIYESKDRISVYGNMVLENKAEDHGGAFFFEECGPVDLYGNVFLRNYCADDGGAVSFEDVADLSSPVRIYNNLFAENIADDRGENRARGGALAFDDTFFVEIVNNTIVGNIVAGGFTPAGGGIDAERNGHEYMLDGDGTFVEPGFSNPVIEGNIIWGNRRLEYDQRVHGGEEDLDYTWGSNFRWSVDEIHVDNPLLQGEWATSGNSESFTRVVRNNILGGYGPGPDGSNVNTSVDPRFVDPEHFDWHLRPDSPMRNQVPADTAPSYDLEMLPRASRDGMVDVGASEFHATQPVIMRIPEGILGVLRMPQELPQHATSKGRTSGRSFGKRKMPAPSKPRRR